jgi:hypothetical protein
LKLLLLGAKEETGDGEAQPLWVPGVDGVLSSREIGKYYTPDLFYYLDFYHQVKRFGLPYGSFLESPWWVLQLQGAFERAYSEIEAYQIRHGVQGVKAKNKMMMDDGW